LSYQIIKTNNECCKDENTKKLNLYILVSNKILEDLKHEMEMEIYNYNFKVKYVSGKIKNTFINIRKVLIRN